MGYQDGFYGKADERWALQDVFSSKPEGILGKRMGMITVQVLRAQSLFR